jgi:membrane associated rhomboid family serine protease
MYYVFTFPPGTETRLDRVPVVTAGITAVLLVVHHLLFHFRPTVDLYTSLALSVNRPGLVMAFTACFVHDGLFHLVGNLLFLVTFGPALEDRIGRWRFLGFYLLAGLVSMLVQVEILRAFPVQRLPVYIVGASGAIAGTLGLFAVRCRFLRVRVGTTARSALGAARGLRLPGRHAQGLGAYADAFHALIERRETDDAVRALEEMRRMTDALRLPPEPVSRLADALVERGDFVRAADRYELAGRDRDPGRSAEHLKRADDIARRYLGDLERAAAAYADAAGILSATDGDGAARDRAARLMEENRACLAVLARRLRFAVPAT